MKLTEKHWKLIFVLARVLLGLAFVVSGFVKAVDPWGTAYKIDDYLAAFDWSFFSGIAIVVSVLLSAFEFFLGTSLILGIYKKTIPLLVLVFMIAVTPLTLYIAISNPVTDCGCFGDAFVISNTATFLKNILLLLLAVFVYFRNDLSYQIYGRNSSFWVAVWCGVFPLILSIFSAQHLPLLDFRPYKIGNHLPDLMSLDDGSPSDSIALIFVYEKEGVKKSFELDDAPIDDPTWKFINREEKVIHSSKLPPIHDFELKHSQLGDITQDILSDTSYVFLMVSSKLEKMNYSRISSLLKARQFAQKHDFRFLALTSSTSAQIEDWKFEFSDQIDFVSVDEVTLKTMIRSNPGLIVLKNGTVVNKWSFRDIPDFNTTTLEVKTTPFKRIVGLKLLFLIPLILLFLLHHGYRISLPWHSKQAKNESQN